MEDGTGFAQMGDAWPVVEGNENVAAVGIGVLREEDMMLEGMRPEGTKMAGMKLEDRKLEGMKWEGTSTSKVSILRQHKKNHRSAHEGEIVGGINTYRIMRRRRIWGRRRLTLLPDIPL